MTSVSGEGAATDATCVRHVEHVAALNEHFGDIARSNVNLASLEVTGDPSCHLASVRIVIVIVMPLALTTGIDVARSGTTSPLSLTRYRPV